MKVFTQVLMDIPCSLYIHVFTSPKNILLLVLKGLQLYKSLVELRFKHSLEFPVIESAAEEHSLLILQFLIERAKFLFMFSEVVNRTVHLY